MTYESRQGNIDESRETFYMLLFLFLFQFLKAKNNTMS